MTKIEAYIKVLKFFDNDTVKTTKWYETPNHLLGDVTPTFLMMIGQDHKLIQFIETSLDENER